MRMGYDVTVVNLYSRAAMLFAPASSTKTQERPQPTLHEVCPSSWTLDNVHSAQTMQRSNQTETHSGLG